MSLREVAEAAYDDLIAGDDEGGGDQESQETGQDDQPRDTKGRFVAREPSEPGEADDGPAAAPAPQESPSEATPTQPAPEAGRSTEPPQHWSADDRAVFSRTAPEAQELILRRHREMEQFVTQRTQAAAQAVEFVSALAPVYQDAEISASLQQAGVTFADAIHQWAGFHKRFMSPDPQVRQGLFYELAQRAGIDPAAMAANGNRPGPTSPLTEEQLKDPTIKFIADTLGKSTQRVQALESTIERIQREGIEQQRAEAQRFTRWGIDTYAEEKDQQGNLLRPHFDAVLPHIIELYRANPQRNLDEAYQTALWMNPQIRSELVNAERRTIQHQASNERARQAVRSNLRGRSGSVTAPVENGQPKSLRQTLEEAADELGI
jgi:hypothetical protein